MPACHDVSMTSFAIKVLVNGAALSVAAFLLKGISFGQGSGTLTGNRLVTVLLVALIFGLLNALIKPVLTFFSLPVIILTLGLFGVDKSVGLAYGILLYLVAYGTPVIGGILALWWGGVNLRRMTNEPVSE